MIKPWLKYYSQEAIRSCEPQCTAYELIYQNNRENLDDIAIHYFGHKITYGELFQKIETVTNAYYALGVRKGDIVILCIINMPETVYSLYALDRLGAIANLVDLRTNEEQMKEYICECNAKYVVTVDLAYSIIKKAIKESHVQKGC